MTVLRIILSFQTQILEFELTKSSKSFLHNGAYSGSMAADSVSHNLDFVLKLNTVKYDKARPRA